MFPRHRGVPTPGDEHGDGHTECIVVREILDRVGDKWSVLVIALLGERGRRFSELRRAIDGISQRMLTLTLRQLERDGLVRRTVHPTVPPRVDYALTPLGESVLEPLTALMCWAQRARHRHRRGPPRATTKPTSTKLAAERRGRRPEPRSEPEPVGRAARGPRVWQIVVMVLVVGVARRLARAHLPSRGAPRPRLRRRRVPARHDDAPPAGRADGPDVPATRHRSAARSPRARDRHVAVGRDRDLQPHPRGVGRAGPAGRADGVDGPRQAGHAMPGMATRARSGPARARAAAATSTTSSPG